MRKMRFCVLAVVLALWPAAARAQDGGFWDFLESFSGPGPAKGFTLTGRLLCIDQQKTVYWACFNDAKQDLKWILRLETTLPYMTTDDHPRFSDTPNDKRPVHIYKFGGTMYYRFHPMLDMGAGLGVYMFSGEGVTQPSRLTATPLSLVFTPFGWVRSSPTATKWGRLLRVNFSETYVMTGISPDKFSSISSYVKGGEFVNNVSLGVDFGSFIGWPK